MREIEEFCAKYRVTEACAERPLWPRVLHHLSQNKVQAKKEDLRALSDATGKALSERGRPAVIVVSEPAPPAPAPEMAAAPAERVRAILKSPEAVGRESHARHLALGTPLPAADAVAVLRTIPIVASTPAAAPRAHADDRPTQGLVRVDPRDAYPTPRDPAQDAKAMWERVAAKLAPSGA
jgi:hypothetical protein